MAVNKAAGSPPPGATPMAIANVAMQKAGYPAIGGQPQAPQVMNMQPQPGSIAPALPAQASPMATAATTGNAPAAAPPPPSWQEQRTDWRNQMHDWRQARGDRPDAVHNIGGVLHVDYGRV